MSRKGQRYIKFHVWQQLKRAEAALREAYGMPIRDVVSPNNALMQLLRKGRRASA